MAENGEKWQKQSNGWEWRKRTDAYKAEIAKVSGTGGTPYLWDVFALPRPEGMVRWNATAKGSCRTLAQAKAEADAAIAAHFPPNPHADVGE